MSDSDASNPTGVVIGQQPSELETKPIQVDVTGAALSNHVENSLSGV
jgi:hypothetical protein